MDCTCVWDMMRCGGSPVPHRALPGRPTAASQCRQSGGDRAAGRRGHTHTARDMKETQADPEHGEPQDTNGSAVMSASVSSVESKTSMSTSLSGSERSLAWSEGSVARSEAEEVMVSGSSDSEYAGLDEGKLTANYFPMVYTEENNNAGVGLDCSVSSCEEDWREYLDTALAYSHQFTPIHSSSFNSPTTEESVTLLGENQEDSLEEISSGEISESRLSDLWDEDLKELLSEHNYDTDPIDEDAARHLLSFGDDYRSFLGSLSGSQSSLAGQGAASGLRKRRQVKKHRRQHKTGKNL